MSEEATLAREIARAALVESEDLNLSQERAAAVVEALEATFAIAFGGVHCDDPLATPAVRVLWALRPYAAGERDGWGKPQVWPPTRWDRWPMSDKRIRTAAA